MARSWKTWLLACGWTAAATCAVADDPADAAGTGLSGLRDARGLNDPVYRWNAHVVQIRADDDVMANDNDYATLYYNDPWDFDEGDTEDISVFSAGILDPRVENGALVFRTAENPFFYWGHHFVDDRRRSEHIGAFWPKVGNRRAVVRIRLKQTATQAWWRVAANSLNRAGKAKVRVRGTDWQVVDFRLYKPRKFQRAFSLCIVPGETPGNQVAIDWVKVVFPTCDACLRKTVTLDRVVEKAQVCVLPSGRYALYVNGKHVAGGYGNRQACDMIDCTEFVRQGENVIAYAQEVIGDRPRATCALEGIVYYQDGGFLRIATDDTWRGMINPPEGWYRAQLDASNWPNVREMSSTAAAWLGAPDKGKGYAIDPPYMGPIGVTFPDKSTPAFVPPIFPADRGTTLRVSVPVGIGRGPVRLTYAVSNTIAGRAAAEGTAAEEHQGEKFSTYALRIGPDAPGVYQVVLRAEQGGSVLDTRFLEVALTGTLAQKEVPCDQVEQDTVKRLVDDIHCGDPEDPHAFLAGFGAYTSTRVDPSATRVGETNGIPYRETGPGRLDWFSYEFRIEHPFRPHLVVVEYLADREQAIDVRIDEAKRAVFRNYGDLRAARNVMSAYTGDDLLYPLTGELCRIQSVYYPQYDRATVTVCNMHAGNRANAVRIRIYEIEDMPAAKVGSPSNRLFGTHTERAYLRIRNFYADEPGDMFRTVQPSSGLNHHRHHGFLKAWYITFANQIRYMRWCGQNLFMPGIWMYSRPYYPSRVQDSRLSPSYDNLRLMFEMFAANGLSLIPSIEFSSVEAFRRYHNFSNQEVRDGAPTIAVVNKDGIQKSWRHSYNYNSFHPVTQQALYDVVQEVVDLYGDCPSMKGVSVISGIIWAPYIPTPYRMESLDRMLDQGYNDFLVDRFVRETGIDVPVGWQDPDRFRKRYQWLASTHPDSWKRFRAQSLKKMHLHIRDLISARHPRLKYYMFTVQNGREVMAEAAMKGRPLRSIFRSLGFDPVLYKDQTNLVLGAVCVPETNLRRRGNIKGLYKAFNTSEVFTDLFDNGPRTALFNKTNWQENELHLPAGTDWLWRYSVANPRPILGGTYFLDMFVSRLVRMTPHMIVFPFTDVQLFVEAERRQRPFACAFRAIADGDYRTLTGDGLDRNIVVRECVNGTDRFFYVLNPYWWTLGGMLRFSEKANVSDRVRGTVLAGGADGCELSFEPYGIRVFRVPASTRLIGADMAVGPRGRSYMANRIRVLNYCRALDFDKAVERLGMWEDADTVRHRVVEIRQRYQAGDLAGARAAMENPLMLRFLRLLEKHMQAATEGPTRARKVYRVNCGCTEPYTDSADRTWLPDQCYEYGTRSYGYFQPGVGNDRGEYVIHGTKDPRIYASERYEDPVYYFQVPNGSYTVILHFAECFRLRPDDFVFDILIEGLVAQEDFDLAKEVRKLDTAWVKTFPHIAVDDGELVVSLPDGKIMGIEVIAED